MSDTNSDTAAKFIGKSIGGGLAVATMYAVILPFSIANAWALTILYGWFVLPLFPALPAIGVVPMLGLVMFKGTMWHRPLPTKKDESDRKNDWWAMAFNIVYGPIGLIFAYPVHWWLT